MKQINWILQANLIKQDVIESIKAALAIDHISFEEVKIIPFSDEFPQIEKTDYFNIFYGSTTLILNAHKDTRYKSGVFLDVDKFNFKNYLQQWGDKMLNFDSLVTTFRDFVTKDYDDNSAWFLRPVEDDKSFSGTVMVFREIKEMAERLINSNNPYLTHNTLISVSSPKKIEKEWRHFIVNKKVISSSRYILNGELNVSATDIPTQLLEFVNQCCSEYAPHDIFVLDTALYNENYYVIECNCFNGTGFYNNDVITIIKAINKHLKTIAKT